MTRDDLARLEPGHELTVVGRHEVSLRVHSVERHPDGTVKAINFDVLPQMFRFSGTGLDKLLTQACGWPSFDAPEHGKGGG